jgi:sulfide:quinone oxidoreductase
MQHKLKSIEPGQQARDLREDREGRRDQGRGQDHVEMPYDYLHVIPPQRAPEVIRQSGLSWADKWTDQGWVEVDQKTLRHLRYPEIFALGDVAGVPKGKTAAR